jgi:hypothetical protein
MPGVNFFGHALVALRRSRDPAFVLGSMLPDLAPMAGLRVRAVDHAIAAAGHALHHTTDAAFHQSASFRELTAEGTRALRDAGVRRGPALGAAHVGVELLLDGWLAERFGVPAVYRESLIGARRVAQGVRWRTRLGSRPFAEFCVRLAEAPVPERYRRPDFTSERLTRVLARHPRLALLPLEQRATAIWLRSASLRVAGAVDALLSETEATLESPA